MKTGLPAELPEPINSLRELAGAEASCTRCPLYRNATQAVPGEGPSRAAIMLVGEQPGDKEDLAGKPFVGPAGRVLDQALRDAGIAREETFITGAVKHFKHEMRGKPIELADGTRLVVTIHPSAVLRTADEGERRKAYRSFVADLKTAATAHADPTLRQRAN
jgi:uracil-DNA glycosylase